MNQETARQGQTKAPQMAEVPFDDAVSILLGSKPEPEEPHESDPSADSSLST